MNEDGRMTRELTLRAIVMGVVLSIVMGAANVYLGLKAGMTVSASIPAAVIAMVVLKGLFHDGTILEANQVQTAASAGESLAAGIIFTMPAMVLIGVWTKFDWWMTTCIAFAGGLLGILLMIPMRKVFVVGDNEELTFPEGVACAAVLEAGQEGGEGLGADAVIKGTAMGALFKALVGYAGVLKGTLEGAVAGGRGLFYAGADISPALVGVGYIVGLNVSALIFIGGAMGWLVGIPVLAATVGISGDPLDAAWELWSTQIRYVGVGAMVVGGIATIVRVRSSLVDAVRVIRGRGEASAAGEDLPTIWIVGLSLAATLLIAGVYFSLTGSLPVAGVTTVIMLVMSLFFTAVASYIVGLVGNSNSPVSGMTITAVLFTGGLMLLFGFTGTQGMVATLGVAAIVCCAACTSGDVCNDLKTGHMVGASPRRQQFMQVVGVGVACVVMAPVLQLLHDNTPGGIGGKELSAPQASLFASLAKGFFGEGTLPWDMVGIGVVLGMLMVAVDKFLELRKASFRAHVMPIAVGIYLPFGLAVPIMAGGLIHAWRVRGLGGESEREAAGRRGLLFASGVIAGEALMGVGLALLASFGVARLSLGLSAGTLTGATSVAAIAILVLYGRASRSD